MVMTAQPSLTPVTTPSLLTVATFALLVLNTKPFSPALAGTTDATRGFMPPLGITTVFSLTLTPVTGCRTVRVQVAFLPLPSLAVAVMMALPGPLAVIMPLSDTVATSALEVENSMLRSSALEGSTVTASWKVSLTLSVFSSGATATEDTGTGLPTLTLQ